MSSPPAVVVTFVVASINEVAGIPASYSPLLWVICYAVFLALNIYGIELSFKVTMIVCLLSLAVLAIFYLSALPHIDFGKYALNIGAGPDGAAVELPDGHGSFFPFGFSGILATLPFAVWLFLAIEQLPLAAEESIDPARDLPKAIMLGMITLIVSAFLVVWLNPSIVGIGSFKLGTSLAPIIDGFGAIYSPRPDEVSGHALDRGLDFELPYHPLCARAGRSIRYPARVTFRAVFRSRTARIKHLTSPCWWAPRWA